MNQSREANRSGKANRKPRWVIVLAIVSLSAIVMFLNASFLNRGPASARFAELREGMMRDEAEGILKPIFRLQEPPDLEEPDPIRQTFTYVLTEESLFPALRADLTYSSGRLESKEWERLKFGDLLAYWWARVSLQ
jgi:hypothetical protein